VRPNFSTFAYRFYEAYQLITLEMNIGNNIEIIPQLTFNNELATVDGSSSISTKLMTSGLASSLLDKCELDDDNQVEYDDE
jgi:hypothetical protein